MPARMTRAHPANGRPGRVWERARRPDDMVEATRWLFAVLALISLAITLVPVLTGSNTNVQLAGVLAITALATSVAIGYFRRSASLVSDITEAAAVLVLALANPNPNVALGYLFAAIWFRSLYGTTVRAALRCALYGGALVGSVLLWPSVPGHLEGADVASTIGVIPSMFVTVVVARHLANILRARQEAARRDAIQAALGSQLLAINDATEIRTLAWAAVAEMCEATPGLQVLKVIREAGVLRPVLATSGLAPLPNTIDLDAFPGASGRHGDGGAVFRSTGLDALGEGRRSWIAVALPDVPDQRAGAWFLLGFSGPVSHETVVSMTSMADQVALALRNGEVHRELTVLATLDNLTGLANRASFNAALQAALTHLRRPGQLTTVLFVDLDDFKEVNDDLGHAAGDELLQEVATRLTRATRPGDVCARLGGDEFAVLLIGAGTAVGEFVAKRIVDAVRAPVSLRDGRVRVGASVGVATATEGVTMPELVHCADTAMYAAKAAGKARVRVYEPGLLEPDRRVAEATSPHRG